MSRITYEEKQVSDGGFGFVTRGLFFKDGKEFARISSNLLDDLKSLKGFDWRNELKTALLYELNDPTLEQECLEVMDNEFFRKSDTTN